jgi:hypothetical protein
MTQGPDVELREARERLAQFAGREHQRDLLRQQAPSHEPERARRRAIKPLGVIDNTQQRALLGGLRQQAEGRHSDQERIRGRPGTVSERDGKGVALWLREALGELQDGGAQLLQRRVGELHLPFDADGAGDLELPRRLDRVLQQRGLADARLSVHDQDPAVPAPGGLQQPSEHLALRLPAEQLRSRRPHHPDPCRCSAHVSSQQLELGSRTTEFPDSIGLLGRPRCLAAGIDPVPRDAATRRAR